MFNPQALNLERSAESDMSSVSQTNQIQRGRGRDGHPSGERPEAGQNMPAGGRVAPVKG